MITKYGQAYFIVRTDGHGNESDEVIYCPYGSPWMTPRSAFGQTGPDCDMPLHTTPYDVAGQFSYETWWPSHGIGTGSTVPAINRFSSMQVPR